MVSPLVETSGSLQVHWNTLAQEISRELPANVKIPKLIMNFAGDRTVVTLSGDDVRLATRLRGARVPVVQLCPASAGWNAWLGYREVWLVHASNKPLQFSSADLTVFVSPDGRDEYQQMLRAEWVGVSVDGSGEWTFAPSDAGHPHWQMDVGEALQQDAELMSALSLLRDTAPVEFGAPAIRGAASFPWQRTGRMHLASAMRPWIDSDLCHGPSELGDIRSWVITTIKAMGTELRRL